MKRILIVDDQESWRLFHTNAIKNLTEENIKIDTAESANDGYTKILENIATPYDIVITDMQMEDDYLPQMAGEWLIEQIKDLSSYYKTNIIIISASPKINIIAKNFEVNCLPKAVAIVSEEAYREIINL